MSYLMSRLTRTLQIPMLVMLAAGMIFAVAASGSDPTPTPVPAPAPKAKATATPVPSFEEALYAAAKAEKEVVWATTDTEERTSAIIAAFEKRYPGIKVSLLTATSAELSERVLLEAKAGKLSVDVTDPGRDDRVVDAGIAADLTGIVNDLGVDPTLVFNDNQVFLKVGVPHAPIYNTNRLTGADIPKTYDDLLDPKYSGEIAVENRLKGFIYLTNLPEYGDTRPDLWGEEKTASYLSKVKANKLQALKGNSGVGDLVASGEKSIALEINLSSFERLRSKGAPVNIVPVAVQSVEPTPHFVTKEGPHPNAGKLFAYFLMSKEGRALWTKLRPSSDLELSEDTEYAKLMKSTGSKIVAPGTAMNNHFRRLTNLYREAIGIPVKK